MKFPAFFYYQKYPLPLAAELVVMSERVGIVRAYTGVLPALLLVVIGWKDVPHHVSLIWLGLALAVATYGRWFSYRYGQHEPTRIDLTTLRRAEWLAALYSGLMGVVWGSSSLLMVAGATTHNFLVIFIYLVVVGIGSAVSIFNLARVVVSLPLGVFIFIAYLPEMFPQEWWWLTLTLLGYVLIAVRAIVNRTQIIVTNLRLRDEKQQLLESQQRETARATEASREKSAFLAAASHDLRQPLHALMLTSHALALRNPEGENHALIARILEAGQVLSTQFNHLLDLSKLESESYQLNPTNTPVTEIMQQVVAAHLPTAEYKQVRLRLRISQRLQTRALFIDGALLRRVIDNLIDNAIKFSPRNSHVLVSARQHQGRIWLRVQDQGTGIPIEQQERIFKPYVQLNNPTRDRNQGIGLGLSIARQAISLLGGDLLLHSRLGSGSCFTVTLPDRLLRDRQVIPPRIEMPRADRLRGKRLLLVEDDPLAAAAFTTWGNTWGLEVIAYADPRDVPLTLAPDLILSDIRLPGERDGIDWLTDRLGEWPDARGLLLSGELSAETHQRAEQEGLLLLTKPVPPDLLLQTLLGMV